MPKQTKNTNTLQIRVDADFFAYRSCQVNEEELDWGQDVITIVSNLKEVIRTFEQDISNLRTQFDTTNVTLYFSDTKNFRKTVDPEYKGNRTSVSLLVIAGCLIGADSITLLLPYHSWKLTMLLVFIATMILLISFSSVLTRT
jgi:hypothetical protein